MRSPTSSPTARRATTSSVSTDRIGAAQAAYVAPTDAPTLPFLAEGPNFGFGGEKEEEQTLADLPQMERSPRDGGGGTRGHAIATAVPADRQQQLGGGTTLQPNRTGRRALSSGSAGAGTNVRRRDGPIAEPPR
jgi:hypothetical protein